MMYILKQLGYIVESVIYPAANWNKYRNEVALCTVNTSRGKYGEDHSRKRSVLFEDFCVGGTPCYECKIIFFKSVLY